MYALGTFDGIHKGHQSVIKEAVQEAKASNAVTIIITFERHPLSILNPERLPKTLLAPAMMDGTYWQTHTLAPSIGTPRTGPKPTLIMPCMYGTLH